MRLCAGWRLDTHDQSSGSRCRQSNARFVRLHGLNVTAISTISIGKRMNNDRQSNASEHNHNRE
ncbi:hypothetical protein AOT82_2262 [Psychrobacter sp. AntiMn-1]|uniref:hypothetical protein n=1 Tax=Psychrobacter sp. AntiMn-1 TaxID=1720344 RepID=UPI0008A6A44E|nr:hypothetical protein [Psychrobacter sp. AntiMn-1]AOY44641.1 hypothetical protein AOT82_2262 [Psychrobacter sp. AntiMn-1]